MLTTTNVLVTFNEPINPTTITATNVFLRTPSNTVVPATVTYDAATSTATITPTAALAYSTLYTGVVKSRRSRMLAGNAMAADFTWTFTTVGAAAAAADAGPGRTGARRHDERRIRSAPTTRRSCAVKGLNAFATADLSTVTGTHAERLRRRDPRRDAADRGAGDDVHRPG